MTSIFEAILLLFMCLMLLVMLLVVARCCYSEAVDTWQEYTWEEWRKR